MKNYICTLFILSFSFINSVFAQPTQADVASMFSSVQGEAKKTISASSLNDSQKKFLSDKTTHDADGFINVEVTDAYVSEIVNVNPNIGFELDAADIEKKVGDLSLIGYRNEGKFRKMFLFGDKSGVRAIASRWDFKADGGSIVVVDEYLNCEVSDLTGTLSRVNSPSSKNTIWKFTGSTESVSYEIILIEDSSVKNINAVRSKIDLQLDFLRNTL